MRIGIDYTSAVRQSAGIGRYTRSLVAALARADEQNDYILLVPSDGRGALVEAAGVPLPPHQARGSHPRAKHQDSNFRLARAPLPERALVTLWQRVSIPLPVEIFIGGVDVFYSPDFVLPPTLSKIKILTVHDLSFKRVPETALPKLKWYLEGAVPRAIKRADLILADSNSTRDDLIDLFNLPAERVQTLYSGVEPYFRRVSDGSTLEAVRTRYGLAKPFVLSVGTIEPRKNLVRLIQAYSRLPQLGDLDLVVAGSRGWMYEEIYRAPQKFGVDPGVRFIGFVPESDLPALYSLARLFVYPSLYEGFGLPVLEALSCGAPVIASNSSSLPEVAGQAAVLVEPHDTDALAEAMARLLEREDERGQLSRLGPARAAKFSWDASACQLLAAFATLFPSPQI
jgi:glycosyltransferase involved in cell wall biosynthesis